MWVSWHIYAKYTGKKIWKKKYIGIYKDDGLTVISYANGPKTERARKNIVMIFKDNNLKNTSECNLSATDFLDVTFDLNDGMYQPYRKPNAKPLYINKNSNHPPAIIKNLSRNIAKRISSLSSTTQIFDNANGKTRKH